MEDDNKMLKNEIQLIQETVVRLFVNTDNKNWSDVEELFAAWVTLDYSSMTGNPASEMSPAEIT